MVQSPSWETNWFAVSQEIPLISRNPKVYCRTHKRPPPVSILGQPSPLHIPTSHLLEICASLVVSHLWVFLNKAFYREGLLAPRPIPKLEDHPSSAVRDCSFNLFAATLLIGGHSSIRNLRTCHAVATGTHYMLQTCHFHTVTLSTVWKWQVWGCGKLCCPTSHLCFNSIISI